jgi:uncharacterized membrane protein
MNQNQHIDQLLKTEDERLRELNQMVSISLEDESLITGKVLREKEEKYSFGERIADRVASFGGSWRFIILFFLILSIWIGVNTALVLQKPFDPYPFILLNLILSCLAAIQAPVIMMSQNRKETKDRQRAQEDYVVNLKAEIEIRSLHKKIDMLMLEHMKNLFEIQKLQCEQLEALDQKIGSQVRNDDPKP